MASELRIEKTVEIRGAIVAIMSRRRVFLYVFNVHHLRAPRAKDSSITQKVAIFKTIATLTSLELRSVIA